MDMQSRLSCSQACQATPRLGGCRSEQSLPQNSASDQACHVLSSLLSTLARCCPRPLETTRCRSETCISWAEHRRVCVVGNGIQVRGGSQCLALFNERSIVMPHIERDVYVDSTEVGEACRFGHCAGCFSCLRQGSGLCSSLDSASLLAMHVAMDQYFQ